MGQCLTLTGCPDGFVTEFWMQHNTSCLSLGVSQPLTWCTVNHVMVAGFCPGQLTTWKTVLANLPPSVAMMRTAGLIPLETRFLHNPSSLHGYVGAALSSNIIHFTKVSVLRLLPTHWA